MKVLKFFFVKDMRLISPLLVILWKNYKTFNKHWYVVILPFVRSFTTLKAAHCLPKVQSRVNATLRRIATSDTSVKEEPPPPPQFRPSRIINMRESQRFLLHLRAEQAFFEENMVSPRFITEYFEHSNFANTRRLAALVLDDKFGCPV